jgi:DNA-dependent RNA polymerase auxiliary subunit epsilon
MSNLENTSTNNVQGLEISPLMMNELLENYNISFVDPIQNAMLEIKVTL